MKRKTSSDVSRYVQLCESKNGKVFFDKLTFIYLEVHRYRKTEEELQIDFEKWICVLKNLHRGQGRRAKLEGRIIEKLFRAAEIEHFDAEERYEDTAI